MPMTDELRPLELVGSGAVTLPRFSLVKTPSDTDKQDTRPLPLSFTPARDSASFS